VSLLASWRAPRGVPSATSLGCLQPTMHRNDYQMIRTRGITHVHTWSTPIVHTYLVHIGWHSTQPRLAPWSSSIHSVDPRSGIPISIYLSIPSYVEVAERPFSRLDRAFVANIVFTTLWSVLAGVPLPTLLAPFYVSLMLLLSVLLNLGVCRTSWFTDMFADSLVGCVLLSFAVMLANATLANVVLHCAALVDECSSSLTALAVV
jgi:hypothetical protein